MNLIDSIKKHSLLLFFITIILLIGIPIEKNNNNIYKTVHEKTNETSYSEINSSENINKINFKEKRGIANGFNWIHIMG